MSTPTSKELVSMCEKLAYKFNNPDHREDMFQEGLLVCYELLAQDPETHPAKLHREAKRRMHDYLNVDTLPVQVPAHNVTKRLARDIEDEFSGNMSDDSFAWLKSVLSSEHMSYDEDFGESPYNHTQSYEDRQYDAHVLSVAITTLTQEEWQVIFMRYFDDLTQQEVADVMATNKMWVSRAEKEALSKLRKWLM